MTGLEDLVRRFCLFLGQVAIAFFVFVLLSVTLNILDTIISVNLLNWR